MYCWILQCIARDDSFPCACFGYGYLSAFVCKDGINSVFCDYPPAPDSFHHTHHTYRCLPRHQARKIFLIKCKMEPRSQTKNRTQESNKSISFQGGLRDITWKVASIEA